MKTRHILGLTTIVYLTLSVGITLSTGSWRPFAVLRGLYDAFTIFLPPLLVIGAVLLRRRAPGIALSYAALALTSVAFRAYATHYHPAQTQVRFHRIVTGKLDRPVRLVHISDIQASQIGAHEIAALARVAALEPDLVIHTGDALQVIAPATYAGELPKLGRLLEAIEAPLGRFNAIGDTDGPIRGALASFAGFRTLDNRGTTIDVGNGRRLRLFGVGIREARDAAAARASVEPWLTRDRTAYNVVFAHPPDFVLGTAGLPVDLSLAGHTHGGQVQLPGFGPLVTLSDVPRKLAHGFHAIGDGFMNTSAGIGAEHAYGLPSIRLNCPPEISVIDIVPARAPVVQRDHASPALSLR